jgi:hypothetical protein
MECWTRPGRERVKAEGATGLAVPFQAWVDRALSVGVPDEARAFSFNLNEHVDCFAMELVGCPFYDPLRQHWVCLEAFASRDIQFRMPHGVVGSSWQGGLAAGVELVKGYLRVCHPRHRFHRAEAITVGFVDGDLQLAWARGKEQGVATYRQSTRFGAHSAARGRESRSHRG